MRSLRTKYPDVNGEKIISIIGFTANFPKWKTDVYRGRLHGGIHRIQTSLNLSRRFIDEITTGGY